MSFVLIVLMTVFTNAKATDFHVANGATDTELAAVLSQATTGDVIWIDGTVTMNAPVEITKNVTIKGVDGAYFDGGEKTRLFEIHPEQFQKQTDF
jgi:nitrous oxidase accessory protein NosD